MAAAKAGDAVYHVDPPSAAKSCAELLYMGFYFTDHDTFLRALAALDFVIRDGCARGRTQTQYPGRDSQSRAGNRRQGDRSAAQRSSRRRMLGARKVHPATSVPGGVR